MEEEEEKASEHYQRGEAKKGNLKLYSVVYVVRSTRLEIKVWERDKSEKNLLFLLVCHGYVLCSWAFKEKRKRKREDIYVL